MKELASSKVLWPPFHTNQDEDLGIYKNEDLGFYKSLYDRENLELLPHVPQKKIWLLWVSSNIMLNGPWNECLLNKAYHCILSPTIAGWLGLTNIRQCWAIALSPGDLTGKEKELSFHFQTHGSQQKPFISSDGLQSIHMQNPPIAKSLSGFL
jgi:hypothetical protein